MILGVLKDYCCLSSFKGALLKDPEGILRAPGENSRAARLIPRLRAAFEALTPGRRRGWIIHFSGAKRSATRASRIEKAAPRILAPKGMHDR